jgi:hypothetical protein
MRENLGLLKLAGPHACSITAAKGIGRAVSYSSVIATSSFEALFCLGYVCVAHRIDGGAADA